MTHKPRVLVVDDSAVVRQVLSEMLARDPDFGPVSTAPDPVLALQRMQKDWPDVIVLDVEMPKMDGITFLRKIMQERPTPVVICSSLTEKGAETTMQALAAGAVEVLTKPRLALKQFLQDSAADFSRAIRAAARANVKRIAARPAAQAAVPAKRGADAILAAAVPASPLRTTEKIIAIGTSTGGTQALEAVLTRLPRVCPGMVIVQHMPEKFTAAFATRLDRICEFEVREARDGDRVMPGLALIAPGGRHLLLERSGAYYRVKVVDGPAVNRHRPSVDVLFRSVSRSAGRNAMGIIMTGMGDDGAAGMKEMHDAGAVTVAQDEASCVVFGMPREAIKRGAVDRVVALDAIPGEILAFATGGAAARATASG